MGKYVYDKGHTNKTTLLIETLSGIKELGLEVQEGKVRAATVAMGVAEVGEEQTLDVGQRSLRYTPVSVGNPHAVIFVEDAVAAPVSSLGPLIERHPNFPNGVNVEFVERMNEHELVMRVWERGSGITMACGTGACASAAAAVRRSLCPADTDIVMHLDGGDLLIRVARDGRVTMSGPAETVYEGEVEW